MQEKGRDAEGTVLHRVPTLFAWPALNVWFLVFGYNSCLEARGSTHHIKVGIVYFSPFASYTCVSTSSFQINNLHFPWVSLRNIFACSWKLTWKIESKHYMICVCYVTTIPTYRSWGFCSICCNAERTLDHTCTGISEPLWSLAALFLIFTWYLVRLSTWW